LASRGHAKIADPFCGALFAGLCPVYAWQHEAWTSHAEEWEKNVSIAILVNLVTSVKKTSDPSLSSLFAQQGPLKGACEGSSP